MINIDEVVLFFIINFEGVLFILEILKDVIVIMKIVDYFLKLF